MDNATISRETEFLERYKSYFSFPVIEKPEFLHGSSKCLIPGEKLKISMNDNHRSDNLLDLERIFEEIRQGEFPERPSRWESIFLWPKIMMKPNLGAKKFIRPTKENNKKILREYMNRISNVYNPLFSYVARIPEGSNVFYGNCDIIDSLLAPYSLVDNRMFNTSSYEMMDEESLRGIIRNYWEIDMKKVKDARIEVLVGGDVEIEGIPTFEFEDAA